jgi:hypothetical protein
VGEASLIYIYIMRGKQGKEREKKEEKKEEKMLPLPSF